MCGVFGFIATKDQPVDFKRLQAIAAATEQRGPHSWGLAWIDGQGRLRCYKQFGRVTSSLAVLRMAHDARMLIGHCRYATHGDPANNLNNHPHRVDRGWLVHNGVVRNYRELVTQHGLWPVTQCDSEVLGLLVEQFTGGMLERCVRAVNLVDTAAPLVLLGLWTRPSQLVAIRRGNPLHMGTCRGGVYLASLPEGLPRDCEPVPEAAAVQFTRPGARLQVTRRELVCSELQPPFGMGRVDGLTGGVEGEGQG